MNKELKKRVEALKKKLKPNDLRQQARELEAASARPDFWQDKETATAKMRELSQLQEELKAIEKLEELLAAGEEKELVKALEKLELATFFSGPYDRRDVLVSIHAGQGGVEAMDWAQMLQRMYLKYFEKKEWQVQIVAENPGEEAGIKNVTMKAAGPYAYGHLKHEAGTHRLVRQSPFNADRLRQTSFALVEVLPSLEKTPAVEIKDDDLEWQFFRASTQGGQNVQKVSSAVRLLHKPTGITVTSQTERYQERNREIALELLRAKLWQRAEQEAEEKRKKLKGDRTKAVWGTQIRSYVLHPYKMVKDLRTGFKTENPESVLDGNLDSFIEAEVKNLS